MSCDLAMRRPAFALFHFNTETKELKIEKIANVDNSTSRAKHGEILYDIAKCFVHGFLDAEDPKYFVREGGYVANGFHMSEMAKFKVVGMMDFLVHNSGWNFDEIAPKSVKKIVTGDGTATKKQVADFLPNYVGERKYECYDESDAIAVGIAWLIKNGHIESKAVKKPTKKTKEEEE